MLRRFCLYGFLKNQRYFEPFLVLVFLGKGLTFFEIGLLVGFREVLINLLEVPSGGMADLWGRRRAMILSFSAYIVAFLVFTWGIPLWTLFLAMAFYAVGEAFRSGTHKAMIFDWLAAQGRTDEKAAVYGTTRAWSQLGSALSVLIAAGIVLADGNYGNVFLYSAIPYALGIVNFLGYPAALDGAKATGGRASVRELYSHLLGALRQCLRHSPLRRLLVESMLQRGTYTTVKDYLQPILEQTALVLPVLLALSGERRLAILAGVLYCMLYLLSALASRRAHRVEARWGGPGPTAQGLWLSILFAYGVLALALGGIDLDAPVLGWHQAAAIAVFVALAVLQNLWKPLFLARIDRVSDADMGATVLSVDGQMKTVFVAVAAPLLGLLVDHWGLVAVAWCGVVTAFWGWWGLRSTED